MDHLPRPSNALPFDIKIPYLCKEKYDGLDFKTYPTRKGWDLNKLQNGQFGDTHPDELGAFLQTWMYFGMLSSVMDVEIRQEDFVRSVNYDENNAEKVICSEKLNELIPAWKDRIDALDPDVAKKLHPEALDKIRFAALVGRHLHPANWSGTCAIRVEIILSIQVLVTTLHKAATWVWKQDWPAIISSFVNFGNNSILAARMHADGWCVFRLSAMWGKMNAATMWYMSLLGPPNKKDVHKNCAWNRCIGNNVDRATYRTLHVTEGCDCTFLSPPMEEIEKITIDGELPVIFFEDSSETPRLQIQRVDLHHADHDYVAISHVWKDGLGNVNTNALPLCQIRKISRKVSRLRKTNDWRYLHKDQPEDASDDEPKVVPFWIDTLCMPATKATKKQTLRMIRDIYRRAKYVLVLDGSLQRSLCNGSVGEVHNRIHVSDWMTRLWTFEEAAVANMEGLQLQFDDGVVRADSKMLNMFITSFVHSKTWEGSKDHIIADRSISELASIRFNANTEVRDLLPIGTRIMALWLGAGDRNVTESGDESIVLAALLGLDAGKIYAEPIENRMKTLLDLQGEWPQQIIFSDGPRLRLPGYQWSPLTFLKDCVPGTPGSIDEYPKTGKVTEQGLLLSRKSFIFLETKADMVGTNIFCHDEAADHWVALQYDKSFNPDDAPGWEEVAPRKGVRSGYLIGDRKTSDNSQWAILVIIYKEEDGILYAKFGCRMTVKVVDSEELVKWGNMLAPWNRPDEEKAKEMRLWPEKNCWETFGRVRECDEDQKWCIG